VVPYISVSYFCTSYFWFFLSLRFPFLTLWFLISVDPMFGVSYFCVPIFVSSYLYVTLKMGKLRCKASNLNLFHFKYLYIFLVTDYPTNPFLTFLQLLFPPLESPLRSDVGPYPLALPVPKPLWSFLVQPQHHRGF